MAQRMDQEFAELTLEVGRRTRENAVIDEDALVPSYGLEDRRLHIRQADLDTMDDKALGELVLLGAQMNLAAQIQAASKSA